MTTVNEHLPYIIDKLRALDAKPKRLLVQVPAGLKQRAIDIVQALEAHGYSCILASDDCFGACDLPLEAARAVAADAILHIGHIKFFKPIATEIPIVYYGWPFDVSVDVEKIAKEISKIKESKIGIVSSVQYLHLLPKIAEMIKSSGKDAIVGGHVLGCWTKNVEALASKVDAVVFVGSGMFHPRGFKCDYFFDFERNELRDVRSDIAKWEKIRWARIANAHDAKTFAILVSTKPGQADFERAVQIKELIESKDIVTNPQDSHNYGACNGKQPYKKAFILVMDKITDAALLGFNVDAFINTACPRLADDRWSKPFVNAADVERLLNEW